MKTKIFWALIMILFSSPSESAPVHITVSSGCKFVLSGNMVLSVTGNLVINGTLSASNTSTVKFCGTALQQIGGSSGVSQFQNVEFNNSANFKLAGDVSVNGTVTLTAGIISAGTKTLSLAENASFSPVTGSVTSFVDGKIVKTGNGSAFTFPTGDLQGATVVWEPLQIAAFNNTNDFSVHFTYKSPYDSLGHPTWQNGSSLGTGLTSVSGIEFWLVNRTGAGNQTPGITLYWNDAVKSDIQGNAVPNTSSTDYETGALDDLTLVHWNSSTSKWDNMGGTATGTWPAGQITSSSAFTDYSPVTFGSKTGSNPLPIQLLSFNAYCNERLVQLQWTTASETNNSYFSIEKCTDAFNWEVVTTIPGQGNSNQLHNYSFTDASQSSAVEQFPAQYYRLKQTDFNGTFTYSDIVQVSCNENLIDIIIIYPNPSHESFQYVVCSSEDREILVKIIDEIGKNLIEEKQFVYKGFNDKVLDVSRLGSATYYFSIETLDGEFCENKQILIK